MSFPQLYGLSFFWTFLVVLVALSLGACSTIGKSPRVVAIDPYNQIVTIAEPVARQPNCRLHGNTWADGFYGCAESHQE